MLACKSSVLATTIPAQHAWERNCAYEFLIGYLMLCSYDIP